MKIKLLSFVLLLLAGNIVLAQQSYLWKTGNGGGYSYKYVTNDPTNSRFYTLKNGLTVILSQNKKEPNISFKMVVRAGSNTDPKTNTGLAHYLEHLLFKGTDKFGTLDYSKEKPLLDKIEGLYEVYAKTTDPAKRAEIYKEIDRISGEAANYSIANEYDKMMKSIGSTTTNAHTSVEETIYHENLPSNAVDKFLAVQSERFRNPIFRIFHTELEAVYEEKNRSLDNDRGKMYEAMLSALFPTHNYGQQTTIGTIAHLKNPSLVEIGKYYHKYYVPNNMAVIMAGDFDFDNMIKKIDQSFSYMVSKPLSLYNPAPEKPLTKVQSVEVYGPSAESLYIAYRGFAQNSKESLMLDLISQILSNGKAGLLDINVNKQQKMLGASAGTNQMKDYGIFVLSGNPKAGQSLEQAKAILLEEIAKLKKGDFDASLIGASVANVKLAELQSFDKNEVRAESLAQAFVFNRGTQWEQMLASTDQMGKLTKQEVIDFANKFFKDNYVVVYKRKGEDKQMAKVDKPLITPVNTNSNEVSLFTKNLVAMPVSPLQPKFLDYKKDLSFGKAGISDVITVQNKENGIFQLSYRFDIGSYNYRELSMAAQYLSFLGTEKMSANEISKAFYNIACSYSVNVGAENTTISVMGLQENFQKAVSLLEDLLANCKSDEKALEDLKQRLLKSRENAKLNKASIMNGLTAYAQYGKDNPFNYGLNNEEIKALKASDLVYVLRNLTNYKHTITYFGPKDQAAFVTDISKLHRLPKEFTPEKPKKTFTYQATDSTKVLFADYDMVQAEVRWVRNAGLYDPAQSAKIDVFNNYFGGGMGSIVFQVIRESKALAYSTYSFFATPDTRSKQSSIISYVGAQADKMKEAINGMNELLAVMPENEKSYLLSKENVMNDFVSTHVSGENIIPKYLADRKLGYDTDARIEQYKALQAVTFSDMSKFHQLNYEGKPYVYVVLASEKKIDLASLAQYGKVRKLSLEEIFGF